MTEQNPGVTLEPKLIMVLQARKSFVENQHEVETNLVVCWFEIAGTKKIFQATISLRNWSKLFN